MTVTRTLIRSSIHHIHSPARVLERVNNLLAPDALNGMFVTAVYAVLNPETGELTYANAGHNLPLLLRGRTGQIETLPKGGIALGVLENSDLREETFWLEPDDSLILYTDGVTDTFGPSQETFGLERLHTVLSGSAGQDARQVIDVIDHALEDFRQGEPLGDDVTLLVVHRKKK